MEEPSEATFGNGPALTFIEKKIAESPHGENEEVIASEGAIALSSGNYGIQEQGGDGKHKL